jgi:hypothetical protein
MRRLAPAVLVALTATAAADPATPAPATPLAIGAPGVTARALALTDDGEIAVSADFGGHLRLWPSLDGKREPVAIAGNPPTGLAIARDGDDVAIAGLDAAGGLELIRTSRAGVPESRAPLDAARPAIAIVAAGDRMIAQRDDGALAIFDLHGARTAILVPAAGEHLEESVARRGRALALITTDGGVRGRWIDLAAGRWGDDTPVLPIAPGAAALSPDLQHLAATAPPRPGRGPRTVIVDLTSGEVTARPSGLGAAEPLGFSDPDTLALILNGHLLKWWRRDGSGRQWELQSSAVVADHHAIASASSDLVISTRAGAHYLGYRMIRPTNVRAVRGGLLLSDGAKLVRVDRGLRRGRLVDFGFHHEPYGPKVVPIDAHHAFAVAGDYQHATIYMVDLDHPDAPTTVATTTRETLQYEPRSRVAAWMDGTTLHLARVGKDGAVSAPATLALTRTYEQVLLLDPARAHSDVAVLLEYDQRTTMLTPITGFTDGGDVTTGERITGDDVTWVAQLQQGDYRPLGFGDRPPLRSPDHTLTAELVGARLTLRDHGTERWTVPVPGVTDVVWTDAGELIAVGDGLARIDLATGALAERQGGWVFGVHGEPEAGGVGSICDAP